jgi:hypothetical protein
MGGLMGEMPLWVAIVAIVLQPLSGVATIVAIDMCSREVEWGIIFPVLLPPLIAFYATWARLPRLRRLMTAPAISAAVWGAILILSVAPLCLALYF